MLRSLSHKNNLAANVIAGRVKVNYFFMPEQFNTKISINMPLAFTIIKVDA